jgi:Holliday junction DNA helicase RuvB
MNPQPINEELTVEGALRPKIWADYIGQDAIKRNLRIILDAAKKRSESPDHLLFYGQAGLGKTTLAYLVASELGARLRVTSGPALEKMGDIAAILSNLEPHDILFIDEIHRLNRLIEEVLYPAMEVRKLHMVIGKGPAARTLSLDLPPFTLIAATTKSHLISAPLRSRFGATFKLDYYETKDIEQIVKKSAQVLNLSINEGAVKMLSAASRFTPRVANRLLKRARDYISVFNFTEINEEAARKTLEMLEIDELGLEPQDRRLLQVIVEKFNGGPVGINTIAAAMSDDPATIEEVYEPYLMRLSFLQRTSSGRVVTLQGAKHVGVYPKGRGAA